MSKPRKQSNDVSQPDDADQRSAAETFLLPTAGAPEKQDEDIAMAAALLRSGLLSDRQLSAAMGDWSVHGSVPLAEHLRERRALTVEQIDDLRDEASASVARLSASAAGEAGGSGSVSLVETLDRYDETGRVARLLGVSAASGGAEAAHRDSGVRYQLIRKLGQGGLGRVWLARDHSLQRLVALKEISNADRATEHTLARFRNEAEITGRLEHPGIVPVYQLGEDAASGFSFYTMRFLGKSTLQDAIAEYHERREEGDDDPMILRNLLTAFVNICHAIGHAHSRKVIHRDLKPENVVIDSFGQVIVIDWGLAKVLDEAAVEQLGAATLSGDGASTAEGQVLGTPLYMAPEQAAGRLDEVDERTDIYGLGAILFSIITGYAPHEKTQQETQETGGGARALISAIVSGPTPASDALNPDVAPGLAAIASRAMARKRYARYQSASALAEDVGRWMADEPVEAYEEPPAMQFRRWVQRHQRLSQVLGGVAAVALAAVVTLGVTARQSQVAQAQADYERMRADVREIELQLRSAANNIAGDARFMAGLPPIQGIIRARGAAKGDAAGEGIGDDEATWRGRLETIYTGLLRSEPTYLAIAYVAAEQGGARELVRVERNVSDPMLIRTLPASRLRFFEEDPYLQKVLEREPGDTFSSLDPRPWQTEAAKRIKRLTIAVPIYAETTGEPFGMVVIEAHVVSKVQSILNDLGALVGDVYITTPDGVVWVAKRAVGASNKAAGQPIGQLVPGAEAAFPVAPGETEATDGSTYIARRVLINPDGDGSGIVVALPEGR
ncbi:MAG: serine/threonine-protein kinase [Planctomycetota bacterium]